jgi:hypothetical protein
MWVVCINNGLCEGASSDSVSLTIGKQYYVPYIRIKNVTDYTGTGPREYRITNDSVIRQEIISKILGEND